MKYLFRYLLLAICLLSASVSAIATPRAPLRGESQMGSTVQEILTTGNDEAGIIATSPNREHASDDASCNGHSMRPLDTGHMATKGVLTLRSKTRNLATQFNRDDSSDDKIVIGSSFIIHCDEFGIDAGVPHQADMANNAILAEPLFSLTTNRPRAPPFETTTQ